MVTLAEALDPVLALAVARHLLLAMELQLARAAASNM